MGDVVEYGEGEHHEGEPHQQVPSSGDLVDRPVGLVRGVPGDVVAQADRGQGDEAVVQRVQEVPVRLQGGEHRGGRQEEDADQHGAHQEQVQQADVEGLVQVAQAGVEELQQHGGGHHEPLHQRSQQHERQGDPQHGVQDAENLSPLGQRGHVSIPYSSDDSAGEEQRLSEAPVGLSGHVPGGRHAPVAGLHDFLN